MQSTNFTAGYILYNCVCDEYTFFFTVHFSDESKVNLFGSDGKQYFGRQTRERLNPECWKVEKKVSCFGGCFLQQYLGLLYSHIAGWMQIFIRTSFSHMQYVPCKHLQISLQFSCKTEPRHTAKRIKQFLDAKNTEMKWLAQRSKHNWNLWKIISNKVMAKKTSAVTKLWKRSRARSHQRILRK